MVRHSGGFCAIVYWLSFHHSEKIPEVISFQGGRIYFDSWIQSIIRWPWSIMAEVPGKEDCSPHGSWEAEERGKGLRVPVFPSKAHCQCHNFLSLGSIS
jgi:hypothetical protein